MGYHRSILSSDLQKETANKYFWRHCNDIIETVHFTVYEPNIANTSKRTKGNKEVCEALGEWKESIKEIRDVRAAVLPELPDFMEEC